MNDDEERLSPRQTHGLKSLKRAIRTLGKRAIDKRTRAGKHHALLQNVLIDALGGTEQLTPQKRVLLDEAVLTKLMLDSVNAWIVAQPTLINKRNKTIIAAVKDRSSLVSVLRTLLGDLGLERKAKVIPSLAEYLHGKGKATKPNTVHSSPSSTPAQLHNPQTVPTPGGEPVQDVVASETSAP